MEVGGLGGEELGAQVAGLGAGGATLTSFAELELEVGGEGDLVVGRAAEGIFAACLGTRLAQGTAFTREMGGRDCVPDRTWAYGRWSC